MLSLIVGMTRNRVIGKDNTLPWNIPEDLKNFKEITLNKTVVMGRKTFDSIVSMLGKPLPNRKNIVLSRNMQPQEGVEVCSMQQILELKEDAFIIGGASIYKQFLPYVDRMYISWIKKDYEGNSLFPEFNLEDFIVLEKKDFEEFEFVIYERRRGKTDN
ncbi:MAG: dihydrofolate reductase [archaeon]